VAVLVIATTGLAGPARNAGGAEPTPSELFDQRILPIFRSPQPASCVQCHLASVDLKNYILPSQEKTFASLRDQGLIDLNRPENSKILTLIRMGSRDPDKGARLIHEKTRRAESAAFAAWIKACCNDPKLRALPRLKDSERARPASPNAVIRHARKSRVVDSFVRNVWSQRMRCFPCHTPFDVDASNPRHQAALKTLGEYKRKYPELADRMKIFGKTPEATMQYLIEKSRKTPRGELPLIDLENPRKSLLVLKPMSKLPRKRPDGKFEPASSAQPVSHMGGLKMHRDDQSYKSFVTWIGDYANVVGDRYASVAELPADNWYASRLVLRVNNAPAAWTTGVSVQLFVHAWNQQAGSWETEPIAFTQGTVTPKRMVNGTLFLLAPTGAGRAPQWDPQRAKLPRGRYLVKTYVDSRRRLAGDPSLLLGEEEFYGQSELKRARWREGFRQAESVFGPQLTKE